MNRAACTLVLASGAGLLAACGVPAKSQADLAKEQAACLAPIELRYSLAVEEACPNRDTRKDCPALPALQADRHDAELKEGCRE